MHVDVGKLGCLHVAMEMISWLGISVVQLLVALVEEGKGMFFYCKLVSLVHFYPQLLPLEERSITCKLLFFFSSLKVQVIEYLE